MADYRGAQQPSSVHCTVVPGSDGTKYICYSSRRRGESNIGLTNGSEVWSTEFTPEMLAQHRQRFEMRTAADYILKIRSACEGHLASLLVQDSGITLELGGPGPGALTLSLTRLQDPEGREEIRGLLFSMAERLREVESTAQSFSPVKTQQRCSSGETDFEPRRRHNGGGASAAVKKRLPGDSLINPGTKRKKEASGVDFDDGEDI
nr:PREDICTED: protein PAXX isoform X1 [Lepisosteus oculatus]